MLGVGCLGWVVWEGKIYMIRIGFVTDFYGSMLTLKSAILVVNSRFLHTQCVTFQIPENCEVTRPGKMHVITIDFVTFFFGSKLTLKIEKCKVSLRILRFRIFWGLNLTLKREMCQVV